MPGRVVSTIEMMVVNAGGVITVQPRTVIEALGLLNGTITGLKGKVDTLDGAYVYRGTVPTEQDLPTTNVNNGDTFNIAAESTYGAAGQNVAWNGTGWDSLGSTLNVSVATQQADGLMSSQDKTKLDGIDAGANAYSLPAATENALGGIKVGENLAIESDGTLSATGGSSASIDLGITGASVGEVAAVAAVDADGKPTAWGAVGLYRTLTITCASTDGTSADGVTVTVSDGDGGTIGTYTYAGQPIALALITGTRYEVSVSDRNGYQTPETVSGTIGQTNPSVTMTYAKLEYFGFRIDSSEADPSDCVTYLGGAQGKTPAHMDFANDTFVWGDWTDAEFFMPRPCMLRYDGTVDYYLDPSDYSKRADGVTASDVADPDYGGNAMMEWGRDNTIIWYKVVPDELDPTCVSVYVANSQLDEDYVCWPFVNNEGEQVAHFYTPIYNGTIWARNTTTNVLRSLSGRLWSSYACKGKTASVEREMARNNNTSLAIWDTEVYCDVILVNLLLTLLCKSLDTQTAFGEGLHTSGSESTNNGFTTGVHDAKGLFYGTSSGAAATYANAVKVFGMENWWGFQWRRFGGLVNDKGQMRYKLTRGTSDGATVSDYVVSATSTDYAGYLEGGTFPSANGAYIQKMRWEDDGAHTPTVAAGQSNKNYRDGLWTNNNQVDYAYRGGASDNGSRVGAWCLSADYAASGTAWHVGASPSCKPQS